MKTRQERCNLMRCAMMYQSACTATLHVQRHPRLGRPGRQRFALMVMGLKRAAQGCDCENSMDAPFQSGGDLELFSADLTISSRKADRSGELAVESLGGKRQET